MSTLATEPLASRLKKGPRRAANARARSANAEIIRYFVGKGSTPAPQLDQEVASEAEGLVAAFKADARLFLIQEFTVAQKIERGRVSLEKKAAAVPPNARVSTPTQVE